MENIKCLITCKSTIEYEGSTIVKTAGEVLGTEDFCQKPVPELAEAIAKVLSQLPRCQQMTVEVGKNIKFMRIESIIRKEIPSENNPDTDLLRSILWHTDIL